MTVTGGCCCFPQGNFHLIKVYRKIIVVLVKQISISFSYTDINFKFYSLQIMFSVKHSHKKSYTVLFQFNIMLMDYTDVYAESCDCLHECANKIIKLSLCVNVTRHKHSPLPPAHRMVRQSYTWRPDQTAPTSQTSYWII